MFGIHSPEDLEGAPESTAAGLDSSSALVRAEADHLQATLRALVTRLGTVPGLNVSVYHQHGRLRRLLGDLPYINDLNRATGPIQRVVVVLGPDSYWLECDGPVLRCGRDRDPSPLAFAAWAVTLFEEIARQNLINHDSLVALRQLVEHDRVG